MCSLHEEQPNARIADVPATRATLAPQDLMTLDAIARQFAVQGKTYWAGVVQRALGALQPPERPTVQATAPNAAQPVVIPISVPAALAIIEVDGIARRRLVGEPGGSYVGLERGNVDDRPPCDTEPA
jgi:hypothetical protein